MKFLFCLLNLLFFDVLFTVAPLDLESSSASRRNSVSFFKTGFPSRRSRIRNRSSGYVLVNIKIGVVTEVTSATESRSEENKFPSDSAYD